MTAELEETAPAPQLVHAGTYALYSTPAGGLHLVYRRTRSATEDGQVLDVEDCPDLHLPEIPPEAIPLISGWLEHGFPPAVLALLQGKISPLKIMGALREAGNGAG